MEILIRAPEFAFPTRILYLWIRGPKSMQVSVGLRPHTHAPVSPHEGQHDGGEGEKSESWDFREGSRGEKARFRVTSQWASEPNTAGKESTSVEDLLCALGLPCRDDFYSLPQAAIASFFFLVLGARLVWVQMPTSPLLGCVTLGSSPNLSEPPFLTRNRSTGGSQAIWWAGFSLCIAPWEGPSL